ncbi:MAG: hypothetical protein A2W36_02585 [Chloroflexi bacterium RBG_16_58_14]|nr:MAG: hypothetical protein A2W36_02585 [Chloroflexi bacterium RBG_16_58_14]
MATEVIMPQLGESVVEGTITRWLKSVGDRVEEYEALLEVNTDKVDSEIPSPASGVLLARLVLEGTTVQAGTLLAWVGEVGEFLAEGEFIEEDEAAAEGKIHTRVEATSPAEVIPAPLPAPPASRGRDLGFISPVVARMASEHNLDLYQIQGSGQGGRITKKDVLAYLESGPTMPVPAALLARAPSIAPSPSALPGEVLQLSAVRRAIADHMLLSKHTSPHVTTVMEVDLSRMVAHRAANKDAFSRGGVNLTYTAYFMAAAVSALKAYPIVNSSWTEKGIQLHRQINIGMATSLGEDGLIVPVIKNADSFSLLGLARAINDLANRARAKKLQPDEVKGGTFTVTNHGISGSLFATPIINQPQCGILGVGMVQKRVVVISSELTGDTIAIRPMAYISLTFDHRILDGAIADDFLSKVVESLQNWD